jgi:hypothetical protein
MAKPNGKPRARQAAAEEQVINVTVQLKGKDAARFRAFKDVQYLKRDAEAGRKLMLERLAQIDAELERAARNAA